MSAKELLQQIHDEADHITGMDRLEESIVLSDARTIKRLAKKALKEPHTNIYQIISPNLGTASFIVKANTPNKHPRSPVT
jgi:hypothetical protein